MLRERLSAVSAGMTVRLLAPASLLRGTMGSAWPWWDSVVWSAPSVAPGGSRISRTPPRSRRSRSAALL